MKKEYRIQLHVVIKVIVIIICASLYAYGGISHKYLRRFVAPFICGVTMLCYSRSWLSLVQMAFLMGFQCMGYGGVALWQKIARRGIFGLLSGSATSILNFFRERWLLVGFQISLVTLSYVLIGVFNPFYSARAEETFLGLLIYTIPILSAEEKE